MLGDVDGRLTVMVFVCSGFATSAALYRAQIPDIAIFSDAEARS